MFETFSQSANPKYRDFPASKLLVGQKVGAANGVS